MIDFSTNKVTPLSKALAIIIFIALPFVGFWLGQKSSIKSNDFENNHIRSNLNYTNEKSDTLVNAHVAASSEKRNILADLEFNENNHNKETGCFKDQINKFLSDSRLFIPQDFSGDNSHYVEFKDGYASILTPKIGVGKANSMSDVEAGYYLSNTEISIAKNQDSRPMIICMANVTGKGVGIIYAVLNYHGGNDKNSQNILVRFVDGRQYLGSDTQRDWVYVGSLKVNNSYTSALRGPNIIDLNGGDLAPDSNQNFNYYESINLIFRSEQGTYTETIKEDFKTI